MDDLKKSFNLKNLLFLICSGLVTVWVFSYLFKSVSWQEVRELITGAFWKGLVLYFIHSVAMSIFRTWRYVILLDVSGFRPSKVSLFLVTLVRNFFSDLLPARLGSLIYVAIVNTRLGVPFGAAASSFAIAFLYDIIAVIPLLALAAFVVASGMAEISQVTVVGGCLVLLAIVVVVLRMIPFMGDKVGSWMIQRFGEEKSLGKLGASFLSAATEMRHCRKSGLESRVFVLSVAVRLMKYGGMYWLLYAMLQPVGYALGDLSVAKIMIGLLMPEAAASLPISGIGGFGAYEFTWSLTFEMLGFPENLAKVTSISHHLVTQLYGWGLGGICLLILMLPRFKKPLQDADESYVAPSKTFYLHLLTASAIVGLCSVLLAWPELF